MNIIRDIIKFLFSEQEKIEIPEIWYENLENLQWVEQFKALSEFDDKRKKIMWLHTKGFFNLCYENDITQQKLLPWAVVYKMLTLFHKLNFDILLPVDNDSFDNQSFSKYTKSKEELIEKGYVKTFRANINKDGDVEIMFLVERGDNGDSDGYGVEPDTWGKGVISSDGKVKVPFYVA
ncbi:MAG: hypothetical protein PHR45_03410 [Muribaculaceae bacterium]|nr:hypothetical protein [Muribaculaceae bacterium]